MEIKKDEMYKRAKARVEEFKKNWKSYGDWSEEIIRQIKQQYPMKQQDSPPTMFDQDKPPKGWRKIENLDAIPYEPTELDKIALKACTMEIVNRNWATEIEVKEDILDATKAIVNRYTPPRDRT